MSGYEYAVMSKVGDNNVASRAVSEWMECDGPQE